MQQRTSFKLYTNPVTDVLKLEGLNENLKTTITIFDADGKILSTSTLLSKTYAKNIRQFAAGTYFMIIATDNKTQTIKFVKQ